MSDEQWVSLAAHDDDEQYFDDFAAKFGLDLRDLG